MFESYLNLKSDYIPNNMFDNFNRCFPKECFFKIGETNYFTQKLDITRNELKTINESYPKDKAVYFIFKSGVSELFTLTADSISTYSGDDIQEADDYPIIAKCEINPNFLEDNNLKLSPYLDLDVQLKMILSNNDIIYTDKKKIKILTTLDTMTQTDLRS